MVMKKILYFFVYLWSLYLIPSDESINFELPAFEEESIRVDMSSSTTTWTKPLIIDANNHDFDNVDTVRLTENIIYKPNPNYVYPQIYTYYPAAIIIAKDNVTIDLAGFNMSLQQTTNANFMINNPIYAIAVYKGVKNVKIISSSPHNRKASISGFSGYAIYINGFNESYNNYDMYSLLVKNIIIDNLLITQNINGIYIANALQATITNTDIIYNYSPRVLYGINYQTVLNGLIDNCRINQNYSYTDVYGISLQDTICVDIKNCQTNINRSLKNGNAFGMSITATSPTTSYTNNIYNCISNRNLCSYVSDKMSAGYYIGNQSHHNQIKESTAYFSSHTQLFPGAIAPITPPEGNGILLDSTNFNYLSNNTVGFHDTYGIADRAAVSSSFFTSNMAILNVGGNYEIRVPTGSGSIRLPTYVLYSYDVTAFTGSDAQLQNLEVVIPS